MPSLRPPDDTPTRLDAALAELGAAIRAELAPTTADPPDRLLSIPEVGAALNLGRTAVYAELRAGRLRNIHVGRRVLVPSSALAEFIADREAER